MLYKTISIVKVCVQSGHCNNVLYFKGREEECCLQVSTINGKYLVQCNTGNIEEHFNTVQELEKYVNEKFSLSSSSECLSCHNKIETLIHTFNGECIECGFNFGATRCTHEYCLKCCKCVEVKRI